MENRTVTLLLKFILLIIVPIQAAGQVTTINSDSLRQELSKETSSHLDKAKAAGQIFRTLEGVSIDSALFFGRLALKYAVLADNDSEISKARFKLANTFFRDDQIDSATHHALAVINNDRFSHLFKERTLLYQVLAGIKIRRSQVDSAGYFMLLARDAARQTEDPYDEIQVNHNLGIIEINKGETIKAIEYLKEVLSLEGGRYPAQRMNSLSVLCGICMQSGLHTFGRPYCYEALSMSESAHMNRSAANIEAYLTQSFLDKNQLDSALVYGQRMANRAVTASQKLRSKLMLARILVRRGEPTEGLKHLKAATSDSRGDVLKKYASTIQQVEGIIQYELGNYAKSVRILKDVEEENVQNDTYTAGRVETIEYLIQASLAAGSTLPPSTVTTLRMVRDSLNRLYAQSASALSVQEYENDKLTVEKQRAEEEAKINKLKLRNRNLLLGLFGLLLITAMAVAALVRRESDRRKRLNNVLTDANQKIAEAKEKLEKQNQRIQERNEQIQALNADLNHRTSNYLSSIRMLLERQRDSALEAGLDVAVVNGLDRQVLAFTQVQEKLNRETFDDVNLREYLTDFCRSVEEALAAGGEPVRFDINVDDVDVRPAFAAPLALIINELATNSLKYARRQGGLLRIALDAVVVNGGELRVFYRDAGPLEGEITSEVFSSSQGTEMILGFTEQLRGRLLAYGEESYDYEAVFGLEG